MKTVLTITASTFVFLLALVVLFPLRASAENGTGLIFKKPLVRSLPGLSLPKIELFTFEMLEKIKSIQNARRPFWSYRYPFLRKLDMKTPSMLVRPDIDYKINRLYVDNERYFTILKLFEWNINEYPEAVPDKFSHGLMIIHP